MAQVKQQDEKKRKLLEEQVAQVKLDPFAAIKVYQEKNIPKPVTKLGVVQPPDTVKRDKSSPHTQLPVSVPWISGKGNSYKCQFYPCCGLRVGQMYCNKINWPSTTQNHHHPGNLVLYSSRNRPGGRAPTGTSVDHIPVCKNPSWSCCSKLSFEPGCTAKLHIII